jgi:hypothetical protein
LLDLGKPILGYPLGSQGVAWEEDLFGNFALLGTDMYAHKFRVVQRRRKGLKSCARKRPQQRRELFLPHFSALFDPIWPKKVVGLLRRVAGHFERGGVKGPDLAYFDPSLTLISCLFYGAFLDMSIA